MVASPPWHLSQPTLLRYYDEADRNRTRGSLVLTVMPRDTVDFYIQFAGGKDEYLADASVPVSRPGELFGLQEAVVKSWNVRLALRPRPVIPESTGSAVSSKATATVRTRATRRTCACCIDSRNSRQRAAFSEFSLLGALMADG